MQQDMLSIVHHDQVHEQFLGVIAEVQALVGRVQPEQLSAPTPCADFQVLGLINHMIFENLAHAALSTGGPIPQPDQATDYIGSDHVGAYGASVEAVASAFVQPVFLTQEFGPLKAPGSMLVQQLIIELLVHGWDLARATGQSANLAPDVAEQALAVVQAWYRGQPRGPGNAFGPEQTAPVDASPADRLAAYLGRRVA